MARLNHMENVLDDPGVLQVVLREYEQHKLPRMMLIKKETDAGNRLSSVDLAFLRELYQEINSFQSFVETHPEYKKLYINFVNVYCSIMDAALDNEKRK